MIHSLNDFRAAPRRLFRALNLLLQHLFSHIPPPVSGYRTENMSSGKHLLRSLEKAPIVMLDTEGQFSQLNGKSLTEALLSIAALKKNEFKKHAEWLSDFRIFIKAESQDNFSSWPKSAGSPRKIHQDLYEKYRRKK